VSQENVEVVRRGLEAWQRDDLDSYLLLIDPDVEWLTGVDRGLGLAASVYYGHDGIRELWNLWVPSLKTLDRSRRDPRPRRRAGSSSGPYPVSREG
jgi:hypothetical protein